MADPKLKEAMAEIMGVLKKHDIAGQIVLASPTHSEFRMKIDASWSCAFPEESELGMMIRFRCKKDEIPDKELRRKRIEETLHAICQIRDLNGTYFMGFDSLVKQLEKHIDFEHNPGSGYEPHRDN